MKFARFAAFSALSLFAVHAQANFVPGRVDTVVECTEGHVNGYSLSITSVEGKPGMNATLYHGGVAGNMPVESFEVKAQWSSIGNPRSSFSDISTSGKSFKLVVSQVASGPDFAQDATLNVDGRGERLKMALRCEFPKHIL